MSRTAAYVRQTVVPSSPLLPYARAGFSIATKQSHSRGVFQQNRPVAVLQLRETGRTRTLATAGKVAMPIVADEVMRFQALYAMASISILVPTTFFACNVEREGLLPGKNSA